MAVKLVSFVAFAIASVVATQPAPAPAPAPPLSASAKERQQDEEKRAEARKKDEEERAEARQKDEEERKAARQKDEEERKEARKKDEEKRAEVRNKTHQDDAPAPAPVMFLAAADIPQKEKEELAQAKSDYKTQMQYQGSYPKEAADLKEEYESKVARIKGEFGSSAPAPAPMMLLAAADMPQKEKEELAQAKSDYKTQMQYQGSYPKEAADLKEEYESKVTRIKGEFGSSAPAPAPMMLLAAADMPQKEKEELAQAKSDYKTQMQYQGSYPKEAADLKEEYESKVARIKGEFGSSAPAPAPVMFLAAADIPQKEKEELAQAKSDYKTQMQYQGFYPKEAADLKEEYEAKVARIKGEFEPKSPANVMLLETTAADVPALTPEQKYANALQSAESVGASLEKKVQELRNTASNNSKIDAIGDAFLKASGYNPNSTFMQSLRKAELDKKVDMRTLSRHAHAAWRTVKHFARMVEHDSAKGGKIPELGRHGYEKIFLEQERLSEKNADRMEDLGGKGVDSIKRIYGHLRKRFQNEEAANAAANKAGEDKPAALPPAPAPAPPLSLQTETAEIQNAAKVQNAAKAAPSSPTAPASKPGWPFLAADPNSRSEAPEPSKSLAPEPFVLLAACFSLSVFVAAVRTWVRRPTQDISLESPLLA